MRLFGVFRYFMKFPTPTLKVSFVFPALVFCLGGAASAATLIGAGAAAMGASLDGAGGRTNVSQTFRYLPAGTYNVADFDFWGVSTSGTVQPFLSSRSATPPVVGQYTPVWAGSAGSAVLGTNTIVYTPGAQQFTLTVPTRIYSGFAMTENAVGFANGGLTDHNGAPALNPVVGMQLPTFSNNNLGRTYSAGIRVTDANPLTSAGVGAGAGIAGATAWDTPGAERLNVDLLFSTLSPGTYSVSDWSLNVFDHTQGGTVTPMLLTGSPGAYTTLWLGSAFDPTSNGAQMAPAFGSFTLASVTEVYAGFFTQGLGSGIIALDQTNAGAGNFSLTDHDSAFTAPSGVGQSVTGFSNPGLGRTYAFEINVIPEPTTLGLLGFVGIALMARRRR